MYRESSASRAAPAGSQRQSLKEGDGWCDSRNLPTNKRTIEIVTCTQLRNPIHGKIFSRKLSRLTGDGVMSCRITSGRPARTNGQLAKCSRAFMAWHHNSLLVTLRPAHPQLSAALETPAIFLRYIYFARWITRRRRLPGAASITEAVPYHFTEGTHGCRGPLLGCHVFLLKTAQAF